MTRRNQIVRQWNLGRRATLGSSGLQIASWKHRRPPLKVLTSLIGGFEQRGSSKFPIKQHQRKQFVRFHHQETNAHPENPSNKAVYVDACLGIFEEFWYLWARRTGRPKTRLCFACRKICCDLSLLRGNSTWITKFSTNRIPKQLARTVIHLDKQEKMYSVTEACCCSPWM